MVQVTVTSLLLILGIFWAQAPSSEATQCLQLLRQQCLLPFGMSYQYQPPQQIAQLLATQDMSQTCQPFLQLQECIDSLESQDCEIDPTDPRVIELRKYIAILDIAINHICRQNVDLFDANKACLFTWGTRAPALLEAVVSQCLVHVETVVTFICPTVALSDCEERVVTEQCNAEIAASLRQLETRMSLEFGCVVPTRHRMKKEMGTPMMNWAYETLHALF